MNKVEGDVSVGIIGCGQIAHTHLKEISLNEQAKTIAVCDRIEVMAEDMAERFVVPKAYGDYHEMLCDSKLDVVHITTPPDTHLRISVDAMEQGCHVYVEKPFGIGYAEAKKIVESARKNKVIACAGFSQLYDLVALRAQKLIREGALGEVVHVESYYGNSLEGNFSRMFLNDKDHWIHKLPGKLFQNIISHALYHMVPLFKSPLERIICLAHDRSRNGVFQDELRVLMNSADVTGYLTFTSAVKPITQFFRIYGTKGILEVDLANHMLSRLEATALPGPVARVRHGLVTGKRFLGEAISHARNMWSGKDRFFTGMGNLFNAFYQNVRDGNLVPPVPYEEVLNVSAVMDEISRQCSILESPEKGSSEK